MANKWLFTVSSVAAILTVIMLQETGTLARLGWGAAVFVTPGFVMGLYRLWERRDNLKHHYEMSKMQFAVIKAQRRKQK